MNNWSIQSNKTCSQLPVALVVLIRLENVWDRVNPLPLTCDQGALVRSTKYEYQYVRYIPVLYCTDFRLQLMSYTGTTHSYLDLYTRFSLLCPSVVIPKCRPLHLIPYLGDAYVRITDGTVRHISTHIQRPSHSH